MSHALPGSPFLPGYELLAEVGRDRLGAIYRARHLLRDGEVRLRLLNESVLACPQDLSAFCNDAARAARLADPAIVPVVEAGDHDGQPYLAEELAAGRSLQEALAEGPLPPADAARIVEAVARAIDRAHQHQVWHGGLCPASILLTSEGAPRIIDFGLSVFLRSDPHRLFPADPSYASPEQAAGRARELGPVSDVHALGATLYALLTGRPPFLGPTIQDTLRQVMQGVPVPPRQLQPSIPPALEAICLKCLHRSPRRRYASAGALADDLARCQEGKPVRVGATARLARAVSWSRRNPVALAAAGAFGLVLVVLIALLVQAGRVRSAALAEAEEQRRLAEEQRQVALSKDGGALRVAQDAEGKVEDARKQVTRIEAQAALVAGERDQANQRARSAEQARAQATKLRNDESTLRALAQGAARDAGEKRDQALKRSKAMAGRMASLYVATGSQLLDAGDPAGAALWFARALEQARGEGLPETAHRLRLAAVLSRCPRLSALWAHDKGANEVRLSRDGRRALVAGEDGTLGLWAVATGDRVQKMNHPAAVRRADLSPDGKFAVSADAANNVYVWDVEKKGILFPALPHDGPVAMVAFSPDGKQFLTVSARDKAPNEAEVRIYDATSGEAVGEALASQIAVRPASFSPDGKHVLTVCLDRSARTWDFLTGNSVLTLEHAGSVVQASYSPDGTSILTASADGTARVWDGTTGKPRSRPLNHGAPLVAAALSPSGRHVLTAGTDRAVGAWDATTGEAVGRRLFHPGAITRVLFSPDGRQALTACDRGTVRLSDWSRGDRASTFLHHNGPVRSADFNATGTAAWTFDGRTFRNWDLTMTELLAPRAAEDEPGSAFSPDGKRVVRVRGLTAQVHDARSKKPLGKALEHKRPVRSAAFSADGKRVLTVTQPAEGDRGAGRDVPTWNVRVWDCESGKALCEPLEHLREVKSASFGADGLRVLTLGADKKVRVWDVAKGAMVGKAIVHDEDVDRALFAPDGKHVVTCGVEGQTRVWEIATGTRVSDPMKHEKPVEHVAFSRDGKRLVTCSADETARVWEVEMGKAVTGWLAHDGPVVAAAFSPDGKRLVTASADRTARIWDVATSKAPTPPLVPRAAPSAVAFSADGQWVVAGCANGDVRIWDAGTGEPISPTLRHAPEDQPVRSVALSAEGELVTEGAPGTKWSRWLRVDKREPESLTALAQAVSGRRVEGVALLVAHEPEELARVWAKLDKSSRDDFDPPAALVRAWQKHAGEECERRELWRGVVLHLSALLDGGGAPPDAHERRARAFAGLRQWERALADYNKALEGPGSVALWVGRADAAAALGRWEQAVTDYSKALDREGRRADLFLKRGAAEAERRQWAKAADDLGKAIRFGRNEPALWHQQAVALVAAGDKVGYGQLCERLKKRFARSADREAARWVARTCTLADGPNLGGLLLQAEKAVEKAPAAADLRRLALLLYRSAENEQAAKRMLEASRQPGQELGPRDALLLALAHHKLGRLEEARKWLSQGVARLPKEAPWHERQENDLWRREAEALIKAPKS